ncbi:PAS domain-containing sensor histidine kinase [Flavobacterium ovatum]|uniref:PAS domain-containing sensor histidine kinase n=1 Tax=Flavobacterium ovatum TaxID=1928857 RepID=UPI00344EC7CA
MLKRTPLSMRKITRPVGIVFFTVCIIQLFRVYYLLQFHQSPTELFKSNSSESLFLLIWESIIILLAYSISLMYNKRLIIDMNAQEEKFSKAFHAAPFMIMLSKFTDGKIFEVNKNVQSISGYHPNELIGFKSSELHIWEQDEDRNKFITDLNSKGVVFENEYVYRKKSGELFPGLMTAEIITINNEKCIISVIQDITIRKQADLKLINSEATLRELNATKDKFFSIIAHDLKSPFNGIIGFSEILKEQVKENDYEGIYQYAEIINTSSHHAMDLLSNLMEWSQSQTGRMKYNPEYVDIVLLIKSTLELLNTSSEQKLININKNTPLGLVIHADKAMIEAVLRNLISNAIKFTPQEGTIIITAEEKENTYLISVADRGVGIENRNVEKLFKIDSSYSTLGTNNEVGTGLGLILCKDFIEYHKGKIWVESELGVGSTFYFSIPKV